MSHVYSVKQQLTKTMADEMKKELDVIITRKALLVASGAKTLEQAKKEISKYLPETKALSKQRIWVDSDKAWNIGVSVAGGCSDSLSLGGSWFTRKVYDVQDSDYGLVGYIKINHKEVKVQHDTENEWSIY